MELPLPIVVCKIALLCYCRQSATCRFTEWLISFAS